MLTIHKQAVTIVLASIATVLMGTYALLALSVPEFSAATQTGPLRIFNLNSEMSIPTWFSQTLLLIAASLLFITGYAATTHRKYWFGLTGIFLYLSLDEGSALHELTDVPIRTFFGIHSGPLFYSWVLLFAVIIIALVAIFIRFYLSLPKKTKLLFFTSAALFIGGAIGFEMVGGMLAAENGETDLAYSLAVAFEEYFEMMGVVIFIYALLDYNKGQKTTVVIE